MATVISTINLKGGVGKSTTTVALAEMLSSEFEKRVLVIDLDPQTNATSMLIGDKRWGELNKEGNTLAQLFKDALSKPEERKFDLQRTRQIQVGNVTQVPTVDLLSSSLDLIDIQDRLYSMDRGRFHAGDPTDLLRRAIKPVIDEYDYVLIDCPPNLGIITLNGLRISHGYIIPVIPDVLSTYGIPQIISRVSDFAVDIGEDIEPLGIVVSKYRAQSTVHNNTVKRLQQAEDAPVFETVIPERNAIAASAEYQGEHQYSTLRQKYGGGEQFEQFYYLTSEIMEATEV